VEEDFTAAIGLAVALGAFAMMFAGLFFVYAGIRVQSDFWPPPGVPRPPVLLPTLNTLVMVGSSLTLIKALHVGRDGDGEGMTKWLGITLLLGLLFVGLQFALWQQMYQSGVTLAASGAFASVLYVLTAVHALHVAAGVLVLIHLYRDARRSTAARSTTGVRVSGMFWHFVDLVWIAMWLSMFVF
jgi:heme/copper-type cytochrome/quinol oxidase subunit 3